MAEETYKMPTPPAAPGPESGSLVGAYIKGRYGSPESGLSVELHHSIYQSYEKMLTDLGVQESKLQQQTVSSFTQAQVAAAQAYTKLHASLVSEMRARGELSAQTMQALNDFHEEADKILTPRSLAASDDDAVENMGESFATLERVTIDYGRVNQQRVENPDNAYLAYVDQFNKVLPTVVTNLRSDLSIIGDNGIRYNTAELQEDRARAIIMSRIMEAERSGSVSGTQFTMEQVAKAAERIVSEKVSPSLTGDFTADEALGREAKAMAAAAYLRHREEELMKLSKGGVSREVLDKVMTNLDGIDDMISGGVTNFSAQVGQIPTSAGFEESRDRIRRAQASLTPDDPYQEAVLELSSVPGFDLWMTTMGFTSVEWAALFAGKHVDEFVHGIRLARDPTIDVEDYRERLGQDAVSRNYSRMAKRLLPRSERPGLRGLIRRLFEGKQDADEDELDDQPDRLPTDDETEFLPDDFLDTDEADEADEVEVAPTEDGGVNEDGSVWVVEGGFRHEIATNGVVTTTRLSSGSTTTPPPGSGPYKAIVSLSAKILGKKEIEVPAAAYEGMKTVQIAPTVGGGLADKVREERFQKELEEVAAMTTSEEEAASAAEDYGAQPAPARETLLAPEEDYGKARRETLPALKDVDDGVPEMLKRSGPEFEPSQRLINAQKQYDAGEISAKELEEYRQFDSDRARREKELAAEKAAAQIAREKAKQSAIETGADVAETVAKVPGEVEKTARAADRGIAGSLDALKTTLQTLPYAAQTKAAEYLYGEDYQSE